MEPLDAPEKQPSYLLLLPIGIFTCLFLQVSHQTFKMLIRDVGMLSKWGAEWVFYCQLIAGLGLTLLLALAVMRSLEKQIFQRKALQRFLIMLILLWGGSILIQFSYTYYFYGLEMVSAEYYLVELRLYSEYMKAFQMSNPISYALTVHSSTEVVFFLIGLWFWKRSN